MLSWAITFLIIAIVAAVLGFGGIAGAEDWHRKTGSRRPASHREATTPAPPGNESRWRRSGKP